MKPEAAEYLDKARECLEHARAILGIQLGEDAGRAAYLAGFHAAQALIFERTGASAKTHRGVQAQFAKLTRHEPRLTVDLRRFLAEAYNLKTVADYETGPHAAIPVDRASAAADTAERLIACIEELLTSS